MTLDILKKIIQDRIDYHKEGILGQHTHTDILAISLLTEILEEYESKTS